MATFGQLTVNMMMENSQFISKMAEASSSVSAATTIIIEQDQTWRSLAASSVMAISRIAGPALQLANTYQTLRLATMGVTVANTLAIPPTVTLAGAMALLASPVVIVGAALTGVAAGVYLFSSREEEAASSTKALSDAASTVAPHLSAMATMMDRVRQSVITDEVASKIGKATSEYQKLWKSVSELGDSLAQPFYDGVSAITGYISHLAGTESVLDAAAKWIGNVTTQVKNLKEWLEKSKQSVFAFTLGFATGMSQEDAKAYAATGFAMNAAAKASFELTGKLEHQKALFDGLRVAQQLAAKEAENSAAVSKISSITSIEGIETEIQRIRDLASERIRNENPKKPETLYDKEFAEQIDKMLSAAEKQKRGILDGTIVDKNAASAKQELAKAQEQLSIALGEKSKIDVAVEKFTGTKEQADLLRQTLEQTEKLNVKKDATKDAESQITRLKQEIDQLTGSSLAAKEALDKMMKDGVSKETIDELKRWTDEKERIKKSQDE